MYPDDYPDLAIEFDAIVRGGRWKNTLGQNCGYGLFEHFMRARALIWPERYRHEWTDLLYQNFVTNDITIMMGAASTQKTSHAAEYVLTRYWTAPQNTLVVVSTIDMDKLDTGVFGEIKMLWEMGRARWPWLSGHLLEHRRFISSEDIAEGDVRDFRRGIIGRPCFPPGQLVDTPSGKVPIENICAGDTVLNAAGIGTVKRTSCTLANQLLRITLADGRTIDCTPEHPFLTEKGWQKAVDVRRGSRVFSAHETLRILQGTPSQRAPQSKVLCGVSQKEVRPMWEGVSPEKEESSFLQLCLLREMGNEPTGTGSENASPSGHAENGCETQSHHPFKSQGTTAAIPHDEGPQSVFPRWSDERGVGFVEGVPGGDSQLQNSQTGQSQVRLAPTLPNRLSLVGHQTCRRSGRAVPLSAIGDRERYQPNSLPEGTRVDRVEILESGSDPRFSQSEGGYRVHNLEVEGHPSYSVNGVIVHNCYVGGRWVGLGKLAGTKQTNIIFLADELQFMAETFIQSWPNLFSNGNVKIIGSGNPKHDPDDQLGSAAEPKEGWASVGEPKETTCWPTRHMGGMCVNLVGTDSPNFKAAAKGLREPYPKLVGPSFAERIAHDWGSDSPEYYSQVKGVMRIDMAVKRVITRMLCREHGAQGSVVWSGKPTTKVLGLDPSYGGSDACVEVILEWGEDVTGETVIRVASWRKIKLNISLNKSIEDQIADAVFEDCEREGIQYTNAFYDPYGKGTIGYAFSRRFPQGRCPIPVDSGGKPTTRPVRLGLFVDQSDNYGQVVKRLKRCDEHYSKFVSEAWFSVRYVIEAGQMRELPDSMMLEGCGRKYDTVAGNKIEVEPKDDMKERGLKSPNQFDALAVALEGARQRGFMIGRLSNAPLDVAPEQDDYAAQEAKKWKKTIQSKLLTYAR